jgi:FeS assembly protein IscX
MPAELKWTDSEDIGIALSKKFPEQNPLEVRFTDLHRYVTELPGFADDAKASNEAKLESIQMAWYEEWQERTAGPSA